jgi:fatty-acyl-CoA synthase
MTILLDRPATTAVSSPSYASGTSTIPLLGETIGQNLDRTVAAYGGHEALVDRASGRRWTYAQLRADVDALANGLLRRGVAKGGRVGVWAANCPNGRSCSTPPPASAQSW